MKNTFKIILLLALGFFTYLMIKITAPYLSFEDDTAFLRIKQWIIHNDIWKTSFYIHVITSCFCLLAGFTQFSNRLLMHSPVIHRTMGWLYIVIVLGFSAPSGLIMGLYANGGVLSQVAFVLLSILWIGFTFMAYWAVRNRDYDQHKKFMIRSYALTLSALTLRAWKFVIVWIFRPHPMDAYLLVAWLGWVPNLLLAEWYIRYKFAKQKQSHEIEPT